MTDRETSDAGSRPFLVISVIVVTASITSLLLVLIYAGLERAALAAALAAIAIAALALFKRKAKSQSDLGGNKRIAVTTALITAVVVVATVSTYRSFVLPDPIPDPPDPPSPTPIRTSKPPKTPKLTPTPEPTPVVESSQPPTSKPPPTESWVKAWKGPFRLGLRTGIDPDTAPASLATGPAGNFDEGDLIYDDSDALSAKLVPYAAFAIPESNSRPDAKVCAEALVTLRSNDPFEPRPGQYLCVGTPYGRLARLEVTDVQEYDYVRFNVVTWKWRQ